MSKNKINVIGKTEWPTGDRVKCIFILKITHLKFFLKRKTGKC
jgi:hypothetical protein